MVVFGVSKRCLGVNQIFKNYCSRICGPVLENALLESIHGGDGNAQTHRPSARATQSTVLTGKQFL
jgi:hypothetical protein